MGEFCEPPLVNQGRRGDLLEPIGSSLAGPRRFAGFGRVRSLSNRTLWASTTMIKQALDQNLGWWVLNNEGFARVSGVNVVPNQQLRMVSQPLVH